MTPAVATPRLRYVLLFFGWSFLLHLLWENLQAPFYRGYMSFEQHFWVCLKATWGDLLFMLAIYASLAIVHRHPFWMEDPSTRAQATTWLTTLVVGVLLAVCFELWAIFVDHRWQYADVMPLIPFLHVGLLPILQMIFIPPLVVCSAYYVARSS